MNGATGATQPFGGFKVSTSTRNGAAKAYSHDCIRPLCEKPGRALTSVASDFMSTKITPSLIQLMPDLGWLGRPIRSMSLILFFLLKHRRSNDEVDLF